MHVFKRWIAVLNAPLGAPHYGVLGVLGAGTGCRHVAFGVATVHMHVYMESGLYRHVSLLYRRL